MSSASMLWAISITVCSRIAYIPQVTVRRTAARAVFDALQRTLHSLEKETSLTMSSRVTCAAGAKRRFVESKWTNNNTSWPLPMQPGQLQNMRKRNEI